MVVDDCKSATIEEDEYDQTFDEDRAACEIERTTPGENIFINVNTPLQLGGRSNPNVEFPVDVRDVGFDGCIKNLIHDGEVCRSHMMYLLTLESIGIFKNKCTGTHKYIFQESLQAVCYLNFLNAYSRTFLVNFLSFCEGMANRLPIPAIKLLKIKIS